MGGVVLITGASTGFGRLVAEALAETDHTPVASMRGVLERNQAVATEFRDAGIDVVEIDVTDDQSVASGVAEVIGVHGRIDVLVNNAGFGMAGPLESVTVEDMRTVFETNVFGVHRMNRAVLPSMRERGDGLLIHISSGAGRIAFPGAGAYSATKWALEAMGEALRYELAPLGIDSVLVEPGRYATDFHDRSLHLGSDNHRATAYTHVIDGIRRRNERLEPGDPREVVETVIRLIATPRGERPTRVFVQPGGVDVLSDLNATQSQIARGVLALFGEEQLLANGV